MMIQASSCIFRAAAVQLSADCSSLWTTAPLSVVSNAEYMDINKRTLRQINGDLSSGHILSRRADRNFFTEVARPPAVFNHLAHILHL